jgi:antitoxin PrlF
MKKTLTKLTSQGQVSVPAAVRNFLHLMPGSLLVWSQDGDRIVVERATRHSAAEVHQALFADQASSAKSTTAPAKTLAELKQGVRLHMQRRHAGR